MFDSVSFSLAIYPGADVKVVEEWEYGSEEEEDLRVAKAFLQLQSCYGFTEMTEEVCDIVPSEILEIPVVDAEVGHLGEESKNF